MGEISLKKSTNLLRKKKTGWTVQKIPIRCSSLTSQLITCSVKSCALKTDRSDISEVQGVKKLKKPWKNQRLELQKKSSKEGKSNHRLHPNLHWKFFGFQLNLITWRLRFQPIWKNMIVKLDHFPKVRDEKKQYLETTTTDKSWIYPQLPLRVTTRMFTFLEKYLIFKPLFFARCEAGFFTATGNLQEFLAPKLMPSSWHISKDPPICPKKTYGQMLRGEASEEWKHETSNSVDPWHLHFFSFKIVFFLDVLSSVKALEVLVVD